MVLGQSLTGFPLSQGNAASWKGNQHCTDTDVSVLKGRYVCPHRSVETDVAVIRALL